MLPWYISFARTRKSQTRYTMQQAYVCKCVAQISGFGSETCRSLEINKKCAQTGRCNFESCLGGYRALALAETNSGMKSPPRGVFNSDEVGYTVYFDSDLGLEGGIVGIPTCFKMTKEGELSKIIPWSLESL